MAQEFVDLLNKHRLKFFHFTDSRNLESIRTHGLLSLGEIKERSLDGVVFGGNDWSHDADRIKGFDAYVHLCFRRSHPMAYCAQQDGRIEKVEFIRVKPDIILKDGVKFTLDVSNKSGINALDYQKFQRSADFKVLYTKTDWSKPEIRARLRAAEKYEILIPGSVPTEYLDL